MKGAVVGLVLFLIGMSAAHAQRNPLDSGGEALPEQTAYDVTYYDLSFRIDPERRELQGDAEIYARVTAPLRYFLVDLDTVYTVTSITLAGKELPFVRDRGVLRIALGEEQPVDAKLRVRIQYTGKPRTALEAPWDGGFTWSRTTDNRHWVATSLQGEGADLWWPCKDHPGDEPDSVSLRYTVPDGLVVASNGILISVSYPEGGYRTWHWFVPGAINNYAVALNVGPYEELRDDYISVDGSAIPLHLWILPERLAGAEWLMAEMKRHLAFYERTLGPYPFRGQKYGVAHTPFLGMEHQTVIAYGSNFKPSAFGYDWLHHHELGHEWWGNLITAADWKDFWIHEGFCTYMQPLYSQALNGREGYMAELRAIRPHLKNRKPVAARSPITADGMYFSGEHEGDPDNDIYYKGAWILHTLRGLIGDEAFFASLRQFLYPRPEQEQPGQDSPTRLVTTEEYITLVEQVSGRHLRWFFDVYLYTAQLPRLEATRSNGTLRLRWITEGNKPFPMPVEVSIGGRLRRVTMSDGTALIPYRDADGAIVLDPNSKILRQ